MKPKQLGKKTEKGRVMEDKCKSKDEGELAASRASQTRLQETKEKMEDVHLAVSSLAYLGEEREGAREIELMNMVATAS